MDLNQKISHFKEENNRLESQLEQLGLLDEDIRALWCLYFRVTDSWGIHKHKSLEHRRVHSTDLSSFCFLSIINYVPFWSFWQVWLRQHHKFRPVNRWSNCARWRHRNCLCRCDQLNFLLFPLYVLNFCSFAGRKHWDRVAPLQKLYHLDMITMI